MTLLKHSTDLFDVGSLFSYNVFMEVFEDVNICFIITGNLKKLIMS